MVSVGIFSGNIERVFALALGATIFWLCFYFIWIGVHWVRWLSAGFSGLIAFAKLIWGMRDGNAVYIIDGTIGFIIAASHLGLAPSVYFFAIRQKETVRWKESIAVAAVFLLLLLSFGTGMITLFGLKPAWRQMPGSSRTKLFSASSSPATTLLSGSMPRRA